MRKIRKAAPPEMETRELPRELSRGISVERFIREIGVASMLVEPHIPPVSNGGVRDDGTLHYDMPFVAGESLRTHLDGEPLPLRERVSVLRDVADAMAYAHGRSIVHGNLEPDKVILSYGTAIVSDFGVARALEAARSSTSNASNGLGVPAYMAPEQFAGAPISAPADVYAWGVMAYEILSGNHPFAGRSSVQQLIAAHETELPVHLLLKSSELPTALIDVIMKSLEKQPRARPTAATIVQVLHDPKLRSHVGDDDPSRMSWPRLALLIVACALGGTIFFRLPQVVAKIQDVLVPGAAKMPAAPISTLAVLPFVNEGAASDEYLSDGLTSDLTHMLARLPGVHVIGRATTLSYKGILTDPVEIGKSLNAGGIITGRIKRTDGRLHVQVRLMDVTSGTELWTTTYDRTPSDLLAVQDEYTRAIAAALTSLEKDKKARPSVETMRGTAEAAAYEFYLQGRAVQQLGGALNFQRAIVLFERAVVVDPKFARSIASVADSYLMLATDLAATRDTMTNLAFQAANRAVTIDPTSADAHLALADALGASLRLSEADAHYAFVLKQLGGEAGAHLRYARNLLAAGRVTKAFDEAKLVSQLDPRSREAANLVALSLLDARRFAEAAVQSRAVLTMDSTYVPASVTLARAKLFMGQPDSAISALYGVYKRDSAATAVRGTLLLAFAAMGRADDARLVRDAMMPLGVYVSDYDELVVALASGNVAAAGAALQRSVERGHSVSAVSESLGCDPLFDPLKTSVTYTAIVDRLGITPCPASTPWPIITPLPADVKSK